MAHTPGPWEWDGGWEVGLLVAGDKEVLDASGGYDETRETPSEADARLIAAAPEMLEALKLVFDLWLKEGIRDGRNVLAEACAMKSAVIAAIAKAEGSK